MSAVRIGLSGLALLVALAFTVVPWLARRVPSRLLWIGLGGGGLLAILGSAFAVAPYPWTDLVVVLVAVTGGLLLGRVMPLSFWPFLCLRTPAQRRALRDQLRPRATLERKIAEVLRRHGLRQGALSAWRKQASKPA